MKVNVRMKKSHAKFERRKDPFANVKILGPSAYVRRHASVTDAEIIRAIREVDEAERAERKRTREK